MTETETQRQRERERERVRTHTFIIISRQKLYPLDIIRLQKGKKKGGEKSKRLIQSDYAT